MQGLLLDTLGFTWFQLCHGSHCIITAHLQAPLSFYLITAFAALAFPNKSVLLFKAPVPLTIMKLKQKMLKKIHKQ